MSGRLHDLLFASAASHPERAAVVDGDRSISYAELDERSARLAELLARLGVSRGDRVGLYLAKSIESVVGIYGVLRAGGVYVPLDPDAPPARLAYIARDCDIRCLLTGVEKASEWEELLRAGASIEALVALNTVDDPSRRPPRVRLLTADALDEQPPSTPSVPTAPDDLAYLLYTSGSTGNPKGVMLSHLNALVFVDWALEHFRLTAEDRLSSHAPLHFDLSIFDLFAAAAAGASVVLVPPAASVFPVELARLMEQREISVWYSVPSVLSALASRGGLERRELSRLRAVLFAGEVFPTKYLRRLMRLLPRARFYNLYGPTETNVCTCYDVPPLADDQTEPIPIGKPIPNVEVFAVTDGGGLAPPGEAGELYVRGPTVMHGYWRDPERTARARLADRFGEDPRGYVYRTGDLVRQGEDGHYRFLGRRDSQVKSRGYRIELGEVESVLYAHPAVVEAAVIAIPDELLTNRIVAFLALREEVSQAELIEFCSRRIPRYMIPESFAFRDALSKTSTGKIDRQRLHAECSTTA